LALLRQQRQPSRAAAKAAEEAETLGSAQGHRSQPKTKE
jgi:hypothetical protein